MLGASGVGEIVEAQEALAIRGGCKVQESLARSCLEATTACVDDFPNGAKPGVYGLRVTAKQETLTFAHWHFEIVSCGCCDFPPERSADLQWDGVLHRGAGFGENTLREWIHKEGSRI